MPSANTASKAAPVPVAVAAPAAPLFDLLGEPAPAAVPPPAAFGGFGAAPPPQNGGFANFGAPAAPPPLPAALSADFCAFAAPPPQQRPPRATAPAAATAPAPRSTCALLLWVSVPDLCPSLSDAFRRLWPQRRSLQARWTHSPSRRARLSWPVAWAA